MADGTRQAIDTPKVNAVYYELDGGSVICIRPSGTEPKLKVYYSLKCENEAAAEEKFKSVKSEFEKLIK